MLLLAVKIIERGGANEPPFRHMNSPLPAVGVVPGFAHRIIRNDIKDQVLRAVIDELMRLAWREEKSIPWFNGCETILVSDAAFAGDDVVKLPLGAVRVVGIRSLARRNAADLDIKRMPLQKVRGVWLASQCLRYLFAGTGIFSFSERPRSVPQECWC